MLSQEEKLNSLRLMLSENVGPVTFNQLMSFYGTATKAIDYIADLSRRGGRKKPIVVASKEKAEEQISLAQEKDVRLLFLKDDDYPTLLKHISDAPPILFVKGLLSALGKKSVAIVGTRNASTNGKVMARQFAKELADNGYNIISGMARGIDRAAHVGALSVADQLATTTAVLGTAVDEIYPEENKDIYNEIAERGCLVSEFPFNAILSPRNFPRRNRIISGLSLGTLVIEAQERSGSLITAREALNQGREVFAVPGSPIDPRSMGPNALIRDGAVLVASTEDICRVLDNPGTFSLSDPVENIVYDTVQPDEVDLSEARNVVLQNLGADIVSLDTMVAETGLDIRLINIILVELELAGRLERFPGNRVSMVYGKMKE